MESFYHQMTRRTKREIQIPLYLPIYEPLLTGSNDSNKEQNRGGSEVIDYTLTANDPLHMLLS